MATSIEALGLCEHCGQLIDISGLPAEAMNADWGCHHCGKKLTNKTFGYDEGGTKIKWVGPDLKWVNQKPAEWFSLGKTSVRV